MSRRERGALGIILAVALGLRLAWCIYAARPPGPGLHDPAFYRMYGSQLAHFNGYRLIDGSPTAYYPPGYAFSLAPFFWLLFNTPLPDDAETAVIAGLNIIWQLVMITLAFFIARRVVGRWEAGAVAAGVLALWPNLIFHTAVALTESLFLMLLLVVVLLTVCAPTGERGWERWRLLSIGGVLGVATLVRPVTVPILPILLVLFVLARVGWRRALGQIAIVGAATALVLAPWVVRNAIVMDEVTLFTNTGDNLCMSRHLGGTGGFELEGSPCFEGDFDELERPAFETARDAHGRRLAIEFVREHPGEELRLIARRFGATFVDDADGVAAAETYGTDPFLSDAVRDWLRGVATGYAALAAGAAVAGSFVLLRARRPVGWFVVLTGAGMLVPPLVFFGDPRFHVPAVPLAAIAAAALVLPRHRHEELLAEP